MATTEVDSGATLRPKMQWDGYTQHFSLLSTLPRQWRNKTAEWAAFAYTLYLFTKSDLKTILMPVATFGLVAASSYDIRSVSLTVIWVWVHLLQFCLANQSAPGAVAEDAANKPWRPIAAGRLSNDEARRLRWMLLPVCLALSGAWGATIPSIALALLFEGYNERGYDSHWALKLITNALGYGSFNLGATCVASGGSFDVFSSAAIPHALASLIILTTVQAQDFQDAAGDAVRGRRTLPLVFPRCGRMFTALAISAWSVVLALYSGLSYMVGFPFVALGVCVGVLFLWGRTEASDRRAFIIYNIWLCFAQVIPLLG